MPNHPAYPRVLMLVAAPACWGGGTVVSKQALDDIAPLTLLPMQLSASTLFLFAMKHVTRSPTEWSSQLLRLAALGMLNPGMAYALGLLGLVSITASMSVLLWALEPVLIVLLAALLLRERVPPALALAMAAALVGVLLIVYQAGAAGDTTGVLLTVAAVGACALYTVAARRLLLDDASVTVALVQQATALVFAVTLFLVVHVVGNDPGPSGPVSMGAWTAAVVSGILYYGLAFWCYLSALSRVPATVAGAFLPLIPVFGVAAGYLIGERLTDRQWIGAAVVVTAVTAVAALQHRLADESAPPAATGSTM
ncbi:MAG: DMT family transporter [Actinomycetota bacterium]|nr:DMT family transporter [Actinomycetota bacterium]